MFTDQTLTSARSMHASSIEAILNHVKNSKDLKVKTYKLSLKNKKQIAEDIKNLKLNLSRGIYGFFVAEDQVLGLQRCLIDFRSKRSRELKSRQAVPSPNLENETKSGCIYIGMISEKNLESRILEHVLGTKSPRTGALKLSLWAGKLKEIKISYIVFQSQDDHDLLCEYEKALWRYYQPAIGRL